jgi:hypothetical protein
MSKCLTCEGLDCDCPEGHGDHCFQPYPEAPEFDEPIEEDEIGGAITPVQSVSCEQCKEQNGSCMIGQYDQDSRLITCPY